MKLDRPRLHFMPIKTLEVHPDKAINPTQDLADKSVYQFQATYRGYTLYKPFGGAGAGKASVYAIAGVLRLNGMV